MFFLLFFAVANAAIEVHFDDSGLVATTGAPFQTIDEFYNGGTTNSPAVGPGPNLGVSFIDGFILTDSTILGYAASPSSPNAVRLDQGFGLVNVAAGVSSAISFSYFYVTGSTPVTVNVYDNVDRTGAILATVSLPIVLGVYTPFVLTFPGTAKSFDFAGADEGAFAIDDLTLGAITGNGNGDPHLVGANGVKFDFNGEPNGDYVLFSAPQLQINMHLAGDGPAIRFMTQIGVVFRNVTMQFGIYRFNQPFFDHLNAQLAPFGAKASYNGWQIRLQLCPGQEIVLTQMHSNTKLYPKLVHDDGSIFYYLDVQITMPHCNDAYGGALGQTYKCKFVEHREEFTFDHATEESFRVKSLKSVDASSFDADAPCSVPPTDARSMIGGMSH